MTQIEIRLRELLARNLFIDKADKARALAADKNNQVPILKILEEMDQKQTLLMGRCLKKDPNFFEHLQTFLQVGQVKE